MSGELSANRIWREGPMSAADEPDPLLMRDPARAPEENVRALVARYKSHMLNANRNFIIDRIGDIEQTGLRPEEEKLNIMARFWFHQTKWPRVANNTFARQVYESNMGEQARTEQAVERLEEVRCLKHPYMNGLSPPSFKSTRYIDMVLNAMKEIAVAEARQRYDRGISYAFHGQSNINLQIPDEMRYFFEHADGVKDPDFRYEGMCSWGIWDDIGHSSQVNSELQVIQHLQGSVIKVGDLPGPLLSSALEIETGFIAGSSERYGGVFWSSYYLFCRRTDQVDSSAYSEPGPWGWRVVFYCHHAISRAGGNQTQIFDDLATFLTWYSSWTNNPHSTRKHVSEVLSWNGGEGPRDEDGVTGFAGLGLGIMER